MLRDGREPEVSRARVGRSVAVAFDTPTAELLTMAPAQYNDRRRHGDQQGRSNDRISDEFASDVDHSGPVA